MTSKKKPKPAPKRRQTIGANPLDAYLGSPSAATKASRRGLAPLGTSPVVEKPARARKAPKVRATFHLPPDLVRELRDAVVGVRRDRPVFTLAALAEKALRSEVERLKKSHNGGKPFPRFEGELEGGRPVGS
jgi:hypothetical protein